jgi:FkbM family methyltransferase
MCFVAAAPLIWRRMFHTSNVAQVRARLEEWANARPRPTDAAKGRDIWCCDQLRLFQTVGMHHDLVHNLYDAKTGFNRLCRQTYPYRNPDEPTLKRVSAGEWSDGHLPRPYGNHSAGIDAVLDAAIRGSPSPKTLLPRVAVSIPVAAVQPRPQIHTIGRIGAQAAASIRGQIETKNRAIAAAKARANHEIANQTSATPALGSTSKNDDPTAASPFDKPPDVKTTPAHSSISKKDDASAAGPSFDKPPDVNDTSAVGPDVSAPAGPSFDKPLEVNNSAPVGVSVQVQATSGIDRPSDIKNGPLSAAVGISAVGISAVGISVGAASVNVPTGIPVLEGEVRSDFERARPLCTYLQGHFLARLETAPQTIVEVGARDLLDSVCLAMHFSGARILSFECHPESIVTCQKRYGSLPEGLKGRMELVPIGLGSETGSLPFHPFVCDNPGASSFFWRVDGKQTQTTTTTSVAIRRLGDELEQRKLDGVGLLCMDVQGYELEVLKGVDCTKIRHVIMEEPNGSFPDGPSHYVGAPSRQTIAEFMKSRGFVEVARSRENDWEDNVMYSRAPPTDALPATLINPTLGNSSAS